MSTDHGAAGDVGVRQTLDPRISIVVPALNEALNLSAVLPQLPAVHEVILVDGDSVDDTIRATRRAMPRSSPCCRDARARATPSPVASRG